MAVRAIYTIRADEYGGDQLCPSAETVETCSASVLGVIFGEDLGTVPLDAPPRFRCLVAPLDPNSATLAADIDDKVKAFLMASGVPFGEGDTDTVRRL